jgi:hypothetical protein
MELQEENHQYRVTKAPTRSRGIPQGFRNCYYCNTKVPACALKSVWPRLAKRQNEESSFEQFWSAGFADGCGLVAGWVANPV